MKKSIFVFCSLLISLILSSCGQGQLFPPSSTSTPLPPTVTPTPTVGRIEGRVFRSDTDLGVANAVVTLNNADLPAEDPSRQVGEILSDEQGNYVFDNLKIGKYSISVTLYPNKYNMQPPLPCDPPMGMYFFVAEGEEETMFALSGQNDEGEILLKIAAFSVDMPTIAVVHKDLDLYCGVN
jgi:hypothetical protein